MYWQTLYWQIIGALPPVISSCAQVWLGYQQSLRPCESGLTLNVDLAATAFLQVQVRAWLHCKCQDR